ncbi:MAG: hypothetical protein H6577_20245 [Lewinellaceae bacterium]|nr:hypothetical protein [Saprospiraceae bacterium]MCB9340461.1 hypothetical protein [Lewinellaceae bacterium]
MKNSLLFLMALCFSFSLAQAQVIYEDFEGGTADLPWNGVNGAYDGVVANPDASGANTSAFVGKYTTNIGSDFNFAIADLPAPADMANYGLVKVKIWSPIAPTQCLLKFEGTGPAVEKFIQITEANKWVQYSLDLTAGAANPTGLTKCLISFNSFLPGVAETFYWDDIEGYEPSVCYETFETGNELGWQGLDGMFTGPVANPAPNSVNSSAQCGEYVKSNTTSYSLLLADTGTPFDLSVLNQFKLQVYTTAPTQVLLKLEGTGGNIERTKNIGVTNAWQEYTFDFSDAAANTGLTKAIIFFDPGVETSGDTYYFDNLCAVPKGVCAGATPNPEIIDDFECNRNATYVNGWDSLSVIPNPAPNPVNNSSMVGKYNDPVGEPFGALVIDYQNPIDLSVKNQLKVKIWSSKIVPVLFKLEGGASPAKEISQDVSDVNQWVEYTVDFSSEALNSHRKIVFFFNAGQDGQPGDVYYIDDIFWAEPTETVIEDFENGAFLPWEPLDQQTLLHGTFAEVNNPAPGGVNTSAKVGKYTKGTATFSTLTAVAPGIIDISQKPQYNLDVWAPIGSVNVTMQLESVSQGNKEVTRDLVSPGNWETVSFDFSEYQNITDWVSINLIFNPGVAEQGAMFFFDNLSQGASTVDPCEGVVAISNIIDDFECQRNYEPGAGASLLETVLNPLASVVNGSTQVGKYEDQPDEPFAALCYDFPAAIDLSVFNQLSIMVLADQAGPVLFKLEGGSSAPAELTVDYTDVGEWQKLSVDFSNQEGMDHKRVCFFFNAGNNHSGIVETYYIDNIALEHAPFTGCIMSFDNPAFTSLEWKYFPNDTDGGFEVVDNPDPSGINTSPKVGKAIENADSGQPWQGMFADLPSYIDLSVTKLVKMKIWSPQIASVTMKLENPATPGAPATSGDNTVPNTKANEWEELTWDFSASPNPLPDDGNYRRVTLIWDINNIPASDVTYYFDDVVLAGGACDQMVGVFEPAPLERLSIAPNPVNDMLRVDNLGEVTRLEIRNILGSQVASVWVGNDASAYLQVGNLQSGMYTLAGFTRDGRLVANAKFVKQ